MGCIRKYHFGCGQPIAFSICTHDVDTGVLTDAASNPSFRLYENETATPILTGSMSKLDDANTTGFYVGSIDVSTITNNFNYENNYTIYIEATVDGITGGMCYGFKAVISEMGIVSIRSTDDNTYNYSTSDATDNYSTSVA